MADTHELCVKTSTKIIVDKLGLLWDWGISFVLKLVVFNYFLRKNHVQSNVMITIY